MQQTGNNGVRRLTASLHGDPKRVITRLFLPGGDGRIESIIGRVMSLTDPEVARTLDQVMRDYKSRHGNLEAVFERHFDAVRDRIDGTSIVTNGRRLLIGAYFTLEYTLESVALFNPSMVFHPDQSGVDDGYARFVLSLRACGEGHVSSIEFRSGTVSDTGDVSLDPPSAYVATELPIENKTYDKNEFYLKLIEMGAYETVAERVLNQLGDRFTLVELTEVLDSLHWTKTHVERFRDLADAMVWLARSSYELEFPPGSDISERVIYPVTENESRGIEDARFVRFTGDDGKASYYATYTAYNGVRTLPQLIETADFRRFRVHTMNGSCVENKGMALFPRKVGGSYVMLARIDGENIYLLRSDNIFFWNEAEKLDTPRLPWEFVQIGNCGSPIETDAGWILLTHGVGPMRQYWMSAMLLDREDPRRVLGHLKQPLLTPTEEERHGYVPNVVYSCGAMAHHGNLIIPYAAADTSTRFATVPIDHLLSEMA